MRKKAEKTKEQFQRKSQREAGLGENAEKDVVKSKGRDSDTAPGRRKKE